MLSTDLADAIVVVTGGSTELGCAIAQEVEQLDARAVVINYASNADAAQETARLVQAGGAVATLVKADVSEDAGS